MLKSMMVCGDGEVSLDGCLGLTLNLNGLALPCGRELPWLIYLVLLLQCWDFPQIMGEWF